MSVSPANWRWLRGDVGVAVPAALVLHAAADKSARSARPRSTSRRAVRHLLGEVGALGIVDAVQLANRGRLAVDVERLGRGHLHAVGQLKALDAGGQLGFAGLRLMLVEPAQQIELGPLLGVGHVGRGETGCRSARPGR